MADETVRDRADALDSLTAAAERPVADIRRFVPSGTPANQSLPTPSVERKVGRKRRGPSPTRAAFALEAAWELEAVGEALVKASQRLGVDDLAMRALSIRVVQLAGVAMDSLGDTGCADNEIEANLTGLCGSAVARGR